MTTNHLLTQLPSYNALVNLSENLASQSISKMLDSDPDRAEDFVVSAAGLTLDYSKALLDRPTRDALLELAADSQWQAKVQAMRNGEAINATENRAALHTLLRASSDNELPDLYAQVSDTRSVMKQWANRINDGQLVGFSGQTITDVVNIGIGGSDLGPRLVTEALTPFHGNVSCHYVANVDPADIQETLLDLSPTSTLFIICSKSFRTEETLSNGLAAKSWLMSAGASTEDLKKHFLAITTNLEAAAQFGVPAANCLPIWDWVGGRYSVWSAVGLSTAIAVGWDNFSQFLRGAEEMDQHFQSAPAEKNLPLLLSLMEVWYCNFLGADNHVVLPYSQHLQKLPDFLQQLTMESNGKSVAVDGTPLNYDTGPVLWGAAGTMGQHSFHQLLHQGTRLCPVDFILPLTTHTGMLGQHRMLVANCLAQSRTLMMGRSAKEAEQALLGRGMNKQEAEKLASHLAMPGNRPNNVITMDTLSPSTLGSLLALYEHRTFCSAMMWGINPFDQWGVALGKEIGAEVLNLMSDGPSSKSENMDASTNRLIESWRRTVR
ncbi:MAG: glucose-6-phosphate isomerase [Cryomorphaceae bacterium]|jgi:glucose-6-phosphate isomerase